MSEEKAIEQVTASMAAVSLFDGPPEEAMVHLICSDGKEIYLDMATSLESRYLKRWLYPARWLNKRDQVHIKMSEIDDLANMPSDVVEKVFRYCYRYVHLQPHQDLDAFDAQFFKDADYSELCRLLKGAMMFRIDCLWHRGIVAFNNIVGEDGFFYHYQDLFSLPF